MYLKFTTHSCSNSFYFICTKWQMIPQLQQQSCTLSTSLVLLSPNISCHSIFINYTPPFNLYRQNCVYTYIHSDKHSQPALNITPLSAFQPCQTLFQNTLLMYSLLWWSDRIANRAGGSNLTLVRQTSYEKHLLLGGVRGHAPLEKF